MATATPRTPPEAASSPSPSSASVNPPPPTDSLVQAWPRSAQWATAFLLGIVLTLLSVHALSYLRHGTRATDKEAGHVLSYRIDLNRASRAELLQLPGVGPALAQSIEAYRKAHGGFDSVDDLRKVPGIGPARLERLRSWVSVGEPGFAADDLSLAFHAAGTEPEKATTRFPPRPPRPMSHKEAALVGVSININVADAAELQRLPGIGKVLSQRILDERAKDPFLTVDDLRRVKGIGPKTLEKLRPYVTTGDAPAQMVRGH
jgi:competence protein ComEA